MPIAKVQLPDGRVARFEVPEGTTQDQVIEFANKAFSGGQAPSEQAPALQPAHEQVENKPPQTVKKMGRGVFDVPEGVDVEAYGKQQVNAPVESFKQMVGNVPESAANLAGDIYTAGKQVVTSPVQTAKGVFDFVAGAVSKAIPGEQESEKTFDAFVDILKERYGDEEALRNTIVNDPVGFAADMAGLAASGGLALKGAGTLSGSSKAAELGRSFTSAAGQIDPISSTARRGGSAISALAPEGKPAQMYESAAKFSTTTPQKERTRMAQLAVDEGIMPTQGGIDKARAMIDGLNQKISGLIDEATETGKLIDENELFVYLDDIRKDAMLTGKPMTNLKAIDNVENQIKTINKKINKGQLTPSEAQRLKQNIYKDVNYATTKEKVRYAEEAQKAVARAAKEQLEKIYPEIKTMNAKEGELINLLKAIERSSSRIANRDIIGIGTPIKGTLGGVVGGTPGAIAGLASGIVDTPLVKSKLAIVLNKLKKNGVDVGGVGTRAAATQIGRAEQEGLFKSVGQQIP